MDSPPPPAPSVLDIVTISQLRDAGNRIASEGMMRARCMVVPIEPATAICRVLGRYKMYVDLRDRGFVPHVMFDGYWEYWITEFMWRNVKPGQRVLDLGANHGYYTLLLADLVGAEGSVVAFEPNPRLVELLGDTVAINGFSGIVAVHQMAVGEAPGVLPFLVPVRDPKNGRLLAPGEALPAELDAARFAMHEVPITTLDAAIPGAVDFVKIDVEGAEESVWRGMGGLIDRSPDIRILLEFNPHRCRDPGGVLGEIAARFALREVTFDGVAVPVTAEQVLGRTEDTILYLSAHDPA